MTYDMYFKRTLIIWWTIYEIQPPEHYVTLIWPLRSSKVKGHNVNLNIIYDIVYLLHINILSYYHRFWYIGKIDNTLDISDLENQHH